MKSILRTAVTLLTMAFFLAACGGGGGSAGATVGTGSGGSGSNATPKLALAMVDTGGLAIAKISGTQSAIVRATLTDAGGAAVANAVVKFTASDSTLLTFTPVAGSALTDANGVASIAVQPASLASAGALTITATATVAAKDATASINLAIGAQPAPKVTVVVVNAAGAVSSSLSGGQNGIVKATFVDGFGVAIANAIVKFGVSDTSLLVLSPVSASALTDSLGVATLTITPKDFTTAGAVTITADAVSGLKNASGTANLAIGSAPLTVGALSFSPALSASLPAFSTAVLKIPVSSGGQPVAVAPGLTMTSLCVGDGTATLVTGAMSGGFMSATYTNKGCTRGTDTISVSFGSVTQTISLGVDSANIGTIQFVGTDVGNTSIVLRGSGGLGRKESAVVTFKLVDQNNVGLAGVDVSFRATTSTGGLTVLPAKATTDANGNVNTTVSSGTIPTPVRVIAEATRNGKTINGLSDALTISTGLPIQKSMSMSAEKFNIEGWNFDGEVTAITVLMADQYGNPVSDGSTVNFVSEGGAVGSVAQGAGSCNTGGNTGGCSVQLKSQAFRPVNGRVTVLAYVQGLEDFVDANGDGQYSCTNFVDAVTGVAAPGAVYRPLVDKCVSGGEPFTDQGDPFLDAGKLGQTSGVSTAGWLDDSYDPANGDLPIPYASNTYHAAGDGKWGVNYIRRSMEFIFSGSDATLIRQDCSSGVCVDWTAGASNVIAGLAGAGCSGQALNFRLVDLHNNPLPAGTTVAAVDADKVAPGTFFPGAVPSTNAIGGTFHTVNIKADTQCASGSFLIKVTTPKGTATGFSFRSN